MENDLKFSGESPVVINYNGNAEDIYAPVRTSSADINIVTDKILDDLYSARKDEVCVRIGINRPETINVLDILDPGSHTDVNIPDYQSITDDNYEMVTSIGTFQDAHISQRGFFATNEFGNFMFYGTIQRDSTSSTYTHTFQYNGNNAVGPMIWNAEDDLRMYYSLLSGDSLKGYFYDGTHSYMITQNGSDWFIYTYQPASNPGPIGGSWSGRTAYYRRDGSSDIYNNYPTSCIVTYLDGTLELIWDKYVYYWDSSNLKWIRLTTQYSDSEGDTYTTMYGLWYHRIKNRNGVIVDAMVCNGLGGEDWIVSLDRTNHTFTKMIKLESSYDIENLFTDDSGELYCIKDTGDIYYWCWQYNAWVKWISFTGSDVTPGTFHLDYVVPKTSTDWSINTGDNQYHKGAESDSDIVFIYYNDSNMKPRVWVLMNISAPTIGYRKEYVTREVQKWDEGIHRAGGGSDYIVIRIGSNYYNLMEVTYSFTDIDGKLNILAKIERDDVIEENVWLLQDDSPSTVTNSAFTRTNKWNLGAGYGDGTVHDYYFYIGLNSYMLTKEGSYWYVKKRSGSSWTSYGEFCSWNSSNSVSRATPGGFDPDDIYCYCDGSVELLNEGMFGVKDGAYTFYTAGSGSSQRTGWKWVANYSLSGMEHSAVRGRWCKNVRVFEDGVIKNIDLAYVGYSESINAFYKMDRTNHTLTRHADSPTSTIYSQEHSGGTYTISNDKFVLTDSQDNLYMWLRDNSYFAWLSPEDWVAFCHLGSSHYVQDSLNLEYQIGDKYYFTLQDNVPGYSSPDCEANVRIVTPPSLYFEDEVVYTDHIVWEGYKMPNTFSQELTLNLDSVQMTAIDPVSILKYVTIDRLLEKPKIVTYRELIGSALSYVMLSVNVLSVESSVSYGGVYDGTNGLLDLQVQVSNFWDESDKPATVYEMIEEILRPFCMVLAYDGDRYVIYNQNKTTGLRNFVNYEIGIDGSLTELVGATEPTYIHNIDTDWISNNVSNATMEINNTYEKVSGVASTMIPTYSTMAMDLIDYTQRDLYEADGLNVQTNKTRGIKKVGEVYSVDAADKWFYIWNGVYVNPEYKLEPWSSPVDWYLNINKAYEYLTGTTTGYGADTGSILNFYGGTANPTATGKEQLVEKSVEVKRRITAYAADNGVPPEFLETADLAWTYSGSGSGSSSSTEGHISKSDSSDAKFGSGIVMGDSDRIIYRQKYEHINMTQTNNPVVDVDISRSFSRTGINTLIPVMNNNTATNCSYSTIGANLVGCDTNYYPPVWNSENIVVNSIYFKRYSAGSTIRCREIWDRRRIDMYIALSDGTYLQFNGKEWVSVSSVSENDDSNSFYLMRLMNNEYLFHTEQRYPVIETSDGEHFALGTESFIYFRDNLDHGVYDHDPGTSGEKMECPPYAGAGQIKNSSEGFISVNLPYVNDPEAAIYVDVYNSSMLGMTGSDTIGSAGPVPFYYPKKNESGYKEIWSCWCDFLPKNLTHIKAEHLDLSISVSTPESNLGQMFSESDIRYEIDSKNDYVEEYDGPSFRVNTFNQLVASSFSYLLFDNAYADPGQFIINGQAGRPECYVVQAYMNWLGTIRKIYNKTIKPLNDGKFSNIMTFITSPEIGENPLMVISDSWDLKTNRHTISSIEDQNIDVEYVMTVDAIELPRMARADRYNLPTAKKK